MRQNWRQNSKSPNHSRQFERLLALLLPTHAHKSNNNNNMKLMHQFFPAAVMALTSVVLASGESEAPSIAPSASPAPSYIDLDPFDWDITRMGSAEIVFSGESDTEIKLRYNISIRDTQVRAFEVDCSTPVPSTVAKMNSKRTIKTPKHADLELGIDFAQNNVTKYPGVWTDVAVGEGLIQMCVRVDLMANFGGTPLSVTFHEQKLFISINLLQGFFVTGIDLNRQNATDETGSVDVDYNLTACHCTAEETCVNSVLSQGSDACICIEATSDNLEIADVPGLAMVQGAFNTTPIVAGVEDPLTQVTINGKKAQIHYQIISAFFSDPFPEDIVVSGAVLLAFVDDNGRRLLRNVDIVNHRVLNQDFASEEKLEENFLLSLAVQSTNQPESKISGACTRGMAAMFAALVAFLL